MNRFNLFWSVWNCWQ